MHTSNLPSVIPAPSVILAKAGIQFRPYQGSLSASTAALDPRLREDDGGGIRCVHTLALAGEGGQTRKHQNL